MMDNIEKVLDRGEKIELLVDKTENLQFQVEALVGYEKTCKHLDEHPVNIKSMGIMKPKRVGKFKGEGMTLHMRTKKEDLYVYFEVLFPMSLTED